MIDWREAILGDGNRLAELAGSFLGWTLPVNEFQSECRMAMETTERSSRQFLGFPGISGWSEDSWWSWLKARASAIESYRVVNASNLEIRWASCTLHVGFLCIEENEEHIENLRCVPEPSNSSAPARSKITTAIIDIAPVNVVAGRVGPNPKSRVG